MDLGDSFYLLLVLTEQVAEEVVCGEEEITEADLQHQLLRDDDSLGTGQAFGKGP